MTVIIGFVAACEKLVGLFNALFKLMESWPPWRRVLVSLVGCGAVVAALAAFWAHISTPEPIPVPRSDELTCTNMDLETYAPEYPDCGRLAYLASGGSCKYPRAAIGTSHSSKEVDVGAFCQRLAAKSRAKR